MGILKSLNFLFNNPDPLNDAISTQEYTSVDGFRIKGDTILGYTGFSKDIVIKPQYEIKQNGNRFISRTITKIADGAFENKEIASLTFDDNVMITKIGNNAFNNNNIKTLTLPNSLREIGKSSFSNNAIDSIDLRNTKLTNIPDYAFKNNRISYVNWDSKIASLGVSCFENNRIGTVDLRETNIKDVPDYSFRSNTITYLYMDSKITSLGIGCFANNDLYRLDLSKTSITKIEDYAFANSHIKLLYLSSKTTFLGVSCFENNYIEVIDLSVMGDIESISAATFKNNQISSITWKSSIKSIEKEAFSHNRITNNGLNLQYSNISYIGEYAFGWNNLNFNILGNNPENIIHLPKTINKIDKGAFNSSSIILNSSDTSKLEVDLFDIDGDTNRFWNQVVTTNVISPTYIIIVNASWYRDHYNKWSLNWFLVDTEGQGRLL